MPRLHSHHVFVGNPPGCPCRIDTNDTTPLFTFAPAREQGRCVARRRRSISSIDHQVFLYIIVDRRYVCLRLVIVVVRHEICTVSVREELLERAVTRLLRECLCCARDIRVGRCTSFITLAMVNVFPEPVTVRDQGLRRRPSGEHPRRALVIVRCLWLRRRLAPS